ncbi:MAG: polyprenyl synthetase family protein [Nanoarchaeota archaeon]
MNPLITQFKQQLDPVLEHYLDQKIRQQDNILVKQMYSVLKDFTMRSGKRIRASITYHGYACIADIPKKKEKDLLFASGAIEIIQSYLLIHDDIIDRDVLRRGGPTVHTFYQRLFKEMLNDHKHARALDQHLGTSFAILIGDLANGLAQDIILNSRFPDKAKTLAAEAMNSLTLEVVHGQALDIVAEIDRNLTEEDVLKIQGLKTAKYTVEAPFMIGAILAGANEQQKKTISAFSKPLGQAFQIQDDILGMFGNEAETGKSAMSDLKEGKMTLLIVKALEKANPKEKKIILTALGNCALTPAEHAAVKRIVQSTGSLDYSKKLAKKLCNQAYAILKQGNFRREGVDFIRTIGECIVNRTT